MHTTLPLRLMSCFLSGSLYIRGASGAVAQELVVVVDGLSGFGSFLFSLTPSLV